MCVFVQRRLNGLVHQINKKISCRSEPIRLWSIFETQFRIFTSKPEILNSVPLKVQVTKTEMIQKGHSELVGFC